MPAAVRLREDYSAETLRGLARRSKNVNQSGRLLSLAAVLSGMDRGGAAKIGGMDRQTPGAPGEAVRQSFADASHHRRPDR
jgi:hypothetical protein